MVEDILEKFPFNVDYSWARWKLLNVLSDFTLFYVEGDIVEIGIGESSASFTSLSKKYNIKVYHCDISGERVRNHTEAGIYFDLTRNSVFLGPSDDFFKEINLPPIALGFIDGNHMYEQVKKDFENLFSYVVDHGVIFLHDTYPKGENGIDALNCGTSYILRQELEKDSRVDCFTFVRSARNVGLTMVRKKPKDLPFYRR